VAEQSEIPVTSLVVTVGTTFSQDNKTSVKPVINAVNLTFVDFIIITH
jgi:hypothetical protein